MPGMKSMHIREAGHSAELKLRGYWSDVLRRFGKRPQGNRQAMRRRYAEATEYDSGVTSIIPVSPRSPT